MPLERDGLQIVIDFSKRKSKKVLKLKGFTITNCFPDNVCLLKNGSVIVCVDIQEHPEGSGVFSLIGFKFGKLENTFNTPFQSSKYHIHIASKLKNRVSEWNINAVKSKMYTTPYKFCEEVRPFKLPDILSSHSKWHVSPLFHLLY